MLSLNFAVVHQTWQRASFLKACSLLLIMWDGLIKDAASPCKPCLAHAGSACWQPDFSGGQFSVSTDNKGEVTELSSPGYPWQTQQKWPTGCSLESWGLRWGSERSRRQMGILGDREGGWALGTGEGRCPLWQVPKSIHIIVILFWIRILNFQSQRVWGKAHFRGRGMGHCLHQAAQR